jgi:hypothetical protein
LFTVTLLTSAATLAESYTEIADHTSGAEPLCTDCGLEVAAFHSLLNELTALSDTPATPPDLIAPVESGMIAGGDFVVSRPGVLIHRACLEPGRWRFDIEQAIVASMIKGMSCLARGEEAYGDNGKGWKTSTRFGIFPRFVRYMDRERWNRQLTPYTRKPKSTVYYDSCENVRTDSYFEATMLQDCEVIEDFGNRPKVFCDRDLSFDQLEFRASEAHKYRLKLSRAYASTGSNDPVILNYNNTTKIYNGPTIVFSKDKTRTWTREYFESVFFHEMIHNLGYVHGDVESSEPPRHNDYATHCQVHCFSDVHKEFTAGEVATATATCFAYEVSDSNSESANKLMLKFKSQ